MWLKAKQEGHCRLERALWEAPVRNLANAGPVCSNGHPALMNLRADAVARWRRKTPANTLVVGMPGDS